MAGRTGTRYRDNRQGLARLALQAPDDMQSQTSISKVNAMPLTLPPLNALRAFEAAARTGSFVAAA